MLMKKNLTLAHACLDGAFEHFSKKQKTLKTLKNQIAQCQWVSNLLEVKNNELANNINLQQLNTKQQVHVVECKPDNDSQREVYLDAKNQSN